VKFKLTNISTGKEVKTNYAGDNEGVLLGADGKLYELVDNGACGDPDCCGAITYYYKDVTNEYKIEFLPEENN